MDCVFPLSLCTRRSSSPRPRSCWTSARTSPRWVTFLPGTMEVKTLSIWNLILRSDHTALAVGRIFLLPVTSRLGTQKAVGI